MMLNKEEGGNPSSNVNMFKTSRVFTYLGIKITPEVGDVVVINYDKFLNDGPHYPSL